ncbi:MAG: DUF2283 domain-containing protein [Gammaproteobacteria bacterium]
MRLEYDPKYNVAYIRFLEGPADDLQTLNISAELNIDMTADGHLYGIEVLNANDSFSGRRQENWLLRIGIREDWKLSAWSKKFKNLVFADETSRDTGKTLQLLV